QEYELLVPVSIDMNYSGAERIPIKSFPKGRVEWNPIDEALDNNPTRKDYILTQQNRDKWVVSLLTQDSQGNYINIGNEKIKVHGNINRLRTQFLVRSLIEQKTHYILGILDDESEDSSEVSQTQFLIFNEQFKLVDSYDYKFDKAPMPYQIYWMQLGKTKKPCWVGYGKKTDTKPSLIGQWENPNNNETSELRFYYLDQDNQLQSISGEGDYKIIDILEPSLEQKINGVVPVILAKNMGTEAKPSYLYDFAKAEIKNAKIENLLPFRQASDSYQYRNLIETRVDKILSLDKSNDEFLGTYWFNENGQREQRVTFFYSQGNQYYDRVLKPLNPLFDAALLVRASFMGQKRAGSFVLTNSEIQFHDFISGQVVSTSLERYTFYPDDFITSIYFPITIQDQEDSKQKLPALYTTETSELQRGVRLLTPVFKKENENSKEKLIELISPAKFRFESRTQSGCRPLNTPVFLGSKGYAFDYFCGD
ncbi:MAG: serine protease, partial [Bdellovibrionales bacterium]|nr:serine protease [Bdellovibrionales bacterium]